MHHTILGYVERDSNMGKDPKPYVIIGSNRDQNHRFYRGYDEHFLFNKVLTFLYILNAGELANNGIEEYLATADGGETWSNDV